MPHPSPPQTVTIEQALHIAIQHHQAGERRQAQAILQHVVAQDPQQVQTLYAWACEAYNNTQMDQAASILQLLLEVAPEMLDARCKLGDILCRRMHYQEAREHYQHAFEARPDHTDALSGLIKCMIHLKQDAEVVALLKQVMARFPGQDLAVLTIFGTAYGQNKKNAEAIECFERVLALHPEHFDTLLSLGVMYHLDDNIERAIGYFERCLKMDPTSSKAALSLADSYGLLGRMEEAIETTRAYLAHARQDAEAHSNLTVHMDHAPFLGDAAIQAERKQWAKRFCGKPPLVRHANRPDPERRLRIGYVSGYFRNHSAANAFAAPILHHDPDQFEVYLYNTVFSNADEVTERFKNAAAQWREVELLPPQNLLEMIREDGIDILVDLASHALNNRLRVFAYRPAPISVSAWGYDHGTGLEAMDYLFSDPVTMPEAQRQHFAETIYDLPCGIHLLPFVEMPEVAPLPALKNGYITLGSFTRSNKISEPMIPLWAKILRQIPESRFILKLSHRNMEHMRPLLQARFADQGVEAERLRIEGWTPQQVHFQRYGEIDFQLDTYPACAAVTGLESLRMGVPLVSWYGDNHASRYTAAFMHNLGVEGWIGRSPEEYVQVALHQAADIPSLVALRGSLRARFDASPLGDHQAYAGAVEAAYREMWRRWCAQS